MSTRSRHQHATENGARAPSLRLKVASIVAALALVMTACAEQITKRGHYFTDSDLQQVQPGMSVDTVRSILGTPDTTSTVASGNAFYYISSTETQKAFMKPSEVDRRVLAVYFDQYGTVQKIAHYGMKDGRVFDYIKRETPSHARDEGILSQLFRNLGKKQLFGD
jgi:outer membrane protein assembly factor BamE (lipoprotein component of BamABCDE complex)